MKDRGPWRLWSTLLLLLTGSLCISTAQSQSYNARGDQGALGFDGVVARHDGYVKGETPTIPQTSFSCSAQPYNPGLYADVETQCQVYHVCFEDRQESFLCGPGTNFNQRILACDFWYNFNCGDSPSFYSVNSEIGKVPDKIPGYRPDQGSRTPYQPQPQPQQPRPQPQQPRPQPQQPRPQPQPQQPRPQIQQPRPQPQPQQPRPQPQPQQPRPRPQPQPQQPRPQPQQPRPQPQRPSYPEFPQQPALPPSTGSFPDRVRIPSPAPQPFQPQPQPELPRQPSDPYQPAQPQPPSFPSPPPFRPAPRPQPPVFRPQPRPEPPRQPQEPLYPGVPCGSGYQGGGGRPCPPSTHQQEEQDGYQFDAQKPPKRIALPPPPPPPRDTPRPVFPPVVSPPRVSRPPLTPAVVRQPEISRPRPPVIDNRSEYHPDADMKGGTGSYRPPQPPRQPQPSRPVGTGYPSYPVAQRPAEKPSRPSYQPPPTLQQEHVDTEFVPPPKEPSRPQTSYVPPPPPPPLPPAQQEVIHSRPPPAVKQPDESNYVRPQPPVSPSVIREQQRPVSRPSRPRPVFPPASDHPNSNIKGGPGYNQPPPQVPRFEPTRIGRPSAPQGGYRPPPPAPQQRPVSSGSTATAVKPAAVKRPSAPAQAVYKPDQGRIKKPSEPQRSVYQPPIQVIDHPQSEVKGERYEPPIRQEPQRVQSPSTSVSGVKRPQPSRQRPQAERPRTPVVVVRPQPPPLPASNVKTVDNTIYDRPQPPAPARVKEPSAPRPQAVSRPSQPSYPDHDHPNANVKGGGYSQRISRPSGPSSSYDQRPVPGSGYQPDYNQPDYKPSRSSPPGSVKTANNIPRGSAPVKDASGGHDRPLSGSQHSVLVNNQVRPDYEAGSSYTRGPEVYPKPEFGRPNTPLQPVSTPSRQAAKLGQPSQNDITRSQVKPNPSAAGSGPRSDVRSDYPYEVPGHQPPHQRQVFPYRENPDHPNESLKGSGAYRPPPPAGFQASASEVQEQQVQAEPEPEPSSDSKLGDTGSE